MASASDIKNYYNQLTKVYLKTYGEIIQAFRPKGDRELLNHIASHIPLKQGMQVADLGCGVGGPARYFSKHYGVKVDGITLSEVQVNEFQLRDDTHGNVKVFCGDYHQLPETFKTEFYDVVLFLESLGHSYNCTLAIREAFRILKPGGRIYIKDFFGKKSNDPLKTKRINAVLASINKNYCYNTLDLEDLLLHLRSQNFEIVTIQKFNFKDDITKRSEFEVHEGIDIFEGEPAFYAADWLELVLEKKNFD
ncbi:MAG: class I SAM-dependent methyltransferase [Chitinophagales bacterium]